MPLIENYVIHVNSINEEEARSRLDCPGVEITGGWMHGLFIKSQLTLEELSDLFSDDIALVGIRQVSPNLL